MASLLRILVLGISCLLTVGAPFTNGNFETKTTSATVVPPGDQSVTGWEIGGAQSNIYWDHMIIFGDIAPTNTQWIQQSFDSVPGVEYRVALRADGTMWDENGFSGFRVELFDSSGAVLFTNEFPAFPQFDYGHNKFLYFTAASTQTVLRITHVFRDTYSAVQIDDIEIVPRAPKASISLHPAIRVEGFAYTPYRIEYADANAPTTWFPLTGARISDEPIIVVDTNSPAPAARLYRVVELPRN